MSPSSDDHVQAAEEGAVPVETAPSPPEESAPAAEPPVEEKKASAATTTTTTATTTATAAAKKKKKSKSKSKSNLSTTPTAAPAVEQKEGWGLKVWLRVTLLLFVVLVGLGVAVYFVGGFNDNDNDNDNIDSSISSANIGNTGNTGDGFDTPAATTPTLAPSELPTVTPGNPTEAPSESPSELPSLSPSEGPTEVPSQAPSNLPTETPTAPPTERPTDMPTEFFIPPNPVPTNPREGYFNYDINDMDYGPNAWHRVNTRNHWLREFDSDGFGVYKGHLNRKDVTTNKCADPARKQSPKDLVETIPCEAYHEIRSRCGNSNIPTENFQILGHTLRVDMPRRPCLDDSKSECNQGRPPIADYPRYSSTFTPWSDLLHLDVKFPGEHTFGGQRFDAELQLFHTHLTPDPQRVSSIGIPIQATSDGFNPEFQLILNFFQFIYESHAAECEAMTIRKNRQLKRNLRAQQGLDEDAYDEEELEWEAQRRWNSTDYERIQRKLLFPPKFNPYSEAFMRDINFFRYDGSITEPPCLDISWWVMIDPMYISLDQLEFARRILFTHVDSNCEATSVHNRNQEVVRPIQPLGEFRDIQNCKAGSFESDIEKGHGNGNKC